MSKNFATPSKTNTSALMSKVVSDNTKDFIRGGIVHRFGSDHAIQTFIIAECPDNSEFAIDQDGSVWVVSSVADPYRIGWVM